MSDEEGCVEKPEMEKLEETSDDRAEKISDADKVPIYIPGPEAVDITPDKDGGVTKEIIRPGTGVESPSTHDTVYVHYVGSLSDGTKFDSSRDRENLFEFTLGEGKVIKAWDMAVATMKRGELCVVKCLPTYGYGKVAKPKIPANSTLIFEIELFDWKGEDISEDHDGGILKSQLKKGEDDYQQPRDFATCDVHITGKFNGRVFEDRDVTFVVGEGEEVGVIKAIEQAAKKSKRGENSKILVKAKYGYGSEGNPDYDIPPDADLEYEVELKAFEQLKDSWQLDFTQKLKDSETLKDKGTKFFKAEKFNRAQQYYEKIVEYLKDEEKQDQEAETRNQLLLAAHLNIALCHLRMNDDLGACHSCDNALQIDPKNEKGLFRRATANLNLHNYEDAAADFKAVVDMDPQNKAAKNQLKIVTEKIRQIRDREKKTYAGMFDKFARADAKKTEVQNLCNDGDNLVSKEQNKDADVSKVDGSKENGESQKHALKDQFESKKVINNPESKCDSLECGDHATASA